MIYIGNIDTVCIDNYVASIVFNLGHSAEEAQNYEEAYKYYSQVIEQEPNNSDAWIGKGISAGALSTTKQQRFTEAITCIKRGLEIDSKENHRREYDPTAISLTKSILAYTTMITKEFNNIYDAKTPESGGDPLGATFRNRRRAEIIRDISNDFRQTHQDIIIRALTSAWNLSSCGDVALNIYLTLNKIKECFILEDSTMAAFEQNLHPVLDKIKNKYPTWKPPEAKKRPFCFIATATMNNYDHPYVVILREYRDKKLEQDKFGKYFIKAYYQYSPPIAELIKSSLLLRKISLYLIIKPSVIVASKALSRK